VTYTRADLTILNRKERVAPKPRPKRRTFCRKGRKVRRSGTTLCHSEPQAKNLGGVGVAVFVTRNGKGDPSVDLRMTRNIVDLKVNEQAAKTFRHSNKE
jgi:hypothetical protein